MAVMEHACIVWWPFLLMSEMVKKREEKRR